MTTQRAAALVLGVSLVAGSSTTLRGLNTGTHRLVNVAAADYAGFDQYLHEALALSAGRETVLRQPDWTAVDLLGLGGEREDDGGPLSGRFYNHFHNPLKPWAEAGLHVFGHSSSSARWMQDPAQSPGGHWAWPDARRFYLEALTAPDARTREAAAADLFRALGQIMHVVVDASVPEHVREDAHPFGVLSRAVSRAKAGNYEYWVSDQHNGETDAATADAEARFRARFLAAPIGVDTGIFRLPLPDGEPAARAPIGRLIDTDTYVPEAPDPNVTLGAAIGIAEVANANFFSEDTVTGQFPFPRRDLLTPNPRVAPRSPHVRAYLAKPAGQGLPVSVALAECATERAVGRWVATRSAPYPCADEAVWEETATHMLPRAVGYARGVLDYFFRGSMRVRRLSIRGGTTFIEIENLGDEEMSGVFDIYARPEAGTADERRERVVRVNGGAPATVAPRAVVTLPVTLAPAERPTPSQILVFRGRIGLEEDGVAAQVFTVPYVLIAQTSHTADLRERCGTIFEYPYRHELAWCDWRPTNPVTEGELITGRSANVIARVSLTPWNARAELVLDGVPVPAGVWQRQGDEPDPRGYRIRLSDATTLEVQLVDGTTVTSRVFGSISAESEASRIYTDSPAGSPPPWYVSATRYASIVMAAHPSYRLVSISGHPNPTDVRTDRFSVPYLVENLRVRDSHGELRYVQRWTDYAHVYWTAPPKGPVLLQEPLKTEFAALPYGPVPRVPVEAVLEREYRLGELDFLRAFVTPDVPPSTLTVVGRRESGT
ncbi:MAG: hypothetical protein HY824_04795 [Acidobacteria bacterium]|nr:hypothetical protein [Acidobacteriota bacterium]